MYKDLILLGPKFSVCDKGETFFIFRRSALIFFYVFDMCIKTWWSVKYKNDITATMTFNVKVNRIDFYIQVYIVQSQKKNLWFKMKIVYRIENLSMEVCFNCNKSKKR